MSTITFPGYGVNSKEVTFVCSRIVCWSLIDFNGVYGTEIELDTGKAVRVRAWPADVKRAVEAALQDTKQEDSHGA